MHPADRKNYRPDIDGLRAIAVISVLINHLNPAILPGGFVGVDIFFVISGYLITSHIYQEVTEKRFSLSNFYKRRINRIAPCLSLVLAMTFLAGIFILSPADLKSFSKIALFAMIGLSNISLWQEYGNYFAGETSEALLLHTWSLGVEEQFYLIWPILMMLSIKIGHRYLLGIFIALAIAGIALSQLGTGIAATASYYLLPTRFFELVIGACIALTGSYHKPSKSKFKSFTALAGILFLTSSLALLSKISSFPGINAVWPCIGTALLIWSGKTSNPINNVLANRYLVFFGLISYSLYLWHWPIIAYANYLNIAMTPSVMALIILASTFLAWLSWKFVEIPMRRTGASKTFSIIFARRLFFPLVLLCLLNAVLTLTNGLDQRFDTTVANLEIASTTKPNILRKGCHVPTSLYGTLPDEKCKLGVSKEKTDGILIGDSFANHFTGMLDVMAKAEGISLLDYTMDGCPPILNYSTNKSQTYAEKCRKRNDFAYEKIRLEKYSYVVLAANWPQDDEAGENLMRSIKSILQSNSKLTIILSNERIDRANSCPIRKIMYKSEVECEVDRKAQPDYLNKIKTVFPEVHILDPNRVICRLGKCSPIIGNTVLYRDNVHLNDLGSRVIGELMLGEGETLY